jgi:putative SOS response-associated peptidase YedK
MCGRLDQNDISRLLVNFDWVDEVLNRSQAPDTWNVKPGTYRPVIRVEDGRLVVDDVYWGYRSLWAAEQKPVPPKKKIAMTPNARREKLLGPYWRSLLRSGRGIVRADGWYEWTGPKEMRQPWHIHRKDREPLFLLAVANFGTFKVRPEEAGFALVTADSLGGMVDVHDRRPVAVSAEDARRWLDPALTPEEAEHLARTAMLDVELFDWFPVTRALNTGGDGPEMGEPIELPAAPEQTTLEL